MDSGYTPSPQDPVPESLGDGIADGTPQRNYLHPLGGEVLEYQEVF
jgi:hypothetical protein